MAGKQASRTGEDKDRIRQAQEAAYRFMSVTSGNRPHYEEAIRARVNYLWTFAPLLPIPDLLEALDRSVIARDVIMSSGLSGRRAAPVW